MNIATPKEPVYYYECSAGDFRLVYFIPPEELQSLQQGGKISEQALEDLPDGVDLGCTEPDFAEFEELYDYRPAHSPDALRMAFFNIFSTTLDWENFRGAGFIPARDLESQLEVVDSELETRDLTPAPVEALPERPTLTQRRQRMDQRAEQRSRIVETLRDLPASGIQSDKTLHDQKFTQITKRDGEPAQKIFAELHQKQKR